MPSVKHKRGTRAALNALRDVGALIPWQVYCLTDEAGRPCVATAVNAYTETALKSEAAGSRPVLIVSADAGSGAASSFQNIGMAFTTVQTNNVEVDTSNGYNKTTFEYNIPITGLWDCSAVFRLPDASPALNYGFGVGIINQDGPSFHWDTFPTGSTNGTNRSTQENRRVFRMTAGDKLRLFAYMDRSGGAGVNKAQLTALFIG